MFPQRKPLLTIFVCLYLHLCTHMCIFMWHAHTHTHGKLFLPSSTFPYVAVPVEVDVRWISLENQKCLSVMSLKPQETCSCFSSSFSSVGLIRGRIVCFPFLFLVFKQPSAQYLLLKEFTMGSGSLNRYSLEKKLSTSTWHSFAI